MIKTIILFILIFLALELSGAGPKLEELGKKHYQWIKKKWKK